MFLFLPSRGTPYDLRFSLFRIPVTISPFFWVTAALLGFSWLYVEPGGPANLIAWILCVLVSILVHEFGHALTMRAFGHWPEVVLHHFGGYATFRGRETPGKSFLITAAGPGVQFLLFGGVFALWLWLTAAGRMPKDGTPLYAALFSMLLINLLWPLLNLLPVFPLDGGRLLLSILELLGVRSASDWTLKTGVVLGTIVAAVFLIRLNFIAGAMFAFMAMENYQTLKGQRYEA